MDKQKVVESMRMEFRRHAVFDEKMFGMRHGVVFLLFLSTVASYAVRVSMSVAIVSMTQKDSEHNTFDWDRATKDKVLSSFFWGYIILQVPAGMIAGWFGGKILVFIAVFSNGVINMLVPLAAAYGGWTAVCVCRVAMGLTQGLLYPSLHGLLGQWVPVSERSRLSTFTYAGAQLGTIIELVASGALSASRWGWPSIFYSVGSLAIIISIVWAVVGASSPSCSKWISAEEKKYIEAYTGSSDLSDNNKMPLPWKKIWTSLPFWAIILAHSGQSLGFWTLLTEMPSYMEAVLGVNIHSNGMLSALPYVAMYILSFVFSSASDAIINKKIFSITVARKIFNTIAFWGPATALLVLSYLPPGHLYWTVGLLTITVGLNGAHYVGFMITHIDISPNFASTLMGITNGIGNIFSIMAPLSVSFVVKDETVASEWREVFFISIGFYLVSNLFFILFMSGNIQEWNEPISKGSIEEGVAQKEQKKQELPEAHF